MPKTPRALVTRPGKALWGDPAAINPQGAAGNGVADVRRAAGGDAVIAALPLTCENGEAILSIADNGYAGISPTMATPGLGSELGNHRSG